MASRIVPGSQGACLASLYTAAPRPRVRSHRQESRPRLSSARYARGDPSCTPPRPPRQGQPVHPLPDPEAGDGLSPPATVDPFCGAWQSQGASCGRARAGRGGLSSPRCRGCVGRRETQSQTSRRPRQRVLPVGRLRAPASWHERSQHLRQSAGAPGYLSGHARPACESPQQLAQPSQTDREEPGR